MVLYGGSQYHIFTSKNLLDWRDEGHPIADSFECPDMFEIPLDGDISRDHYQHFTDRFLKAFKRSGMALASRLLAMKRPDTFVCVNNLNRQGLFSAFRLSPSTDAEAYWELIERVRASTWWNVPPPAAGDEREVWSARAAFLDALFYTGVGM